jgi:hypothetical protein
LSFTGARLSLSLDGESIPHSLVYRRDEVARLRDAAAIVDRARRAAFAIVQNAHETAHAIEARAATACRGRERDAQIALVAQARALEESYRLAQVSLTVQWEERLDRVLAAALAQLGATVPPQQRLQIVCEQLAREAGSAPGACLHLRAADAAVCRGAGLRLPWATEIDDTLAAGHCRLMSEHAYWLLDFDTFWAALVAAAGASRAGQAV